MGYVERRVWEKDKKKRRRRRRRGRKENRKKEKKSRKRKGKKSAKGKKRRKEEWIEKEIDMNPKNSGIDGKTVPDVTVVCLYHHPSRRKSLVASCLLTMLP